MNTISLSREVASPTGCSSASLLFQEFTTSLLLAEDDQVYSEQRLSYIVKEGKFLRGDRFIHKPESFRTEGFVMRWTNWS